MNRHVESFWEQKQDRLLDLHNDIESKIDDLVSMIENDLNITEEEYEKLDELTGKLYNAVSYLKEEII